MTRSEHSWAHRLIRRGLVAAVVISALAVYGLVTAGTQSLSLRPTAATATGAASELALSEAVSPTNGSLDLATRGPNNSLFFYWNVGGKWYGPLGIGAAGTTFSAPSIVAETDGNFDIVAQGPGNSLLLWWDASGTWYGPLAIGPSNSAFSTPSIALEQYPSSGANLDVAVQGPGNSLSLFWDVASTAQWYGPYTVDGVNSTFSAPSLSAYAYTNSPNTYNELFISNVGTNNDLRSHFYDQQAGKWQSTDSANDGNVYSAPSQEYDYSVFEGPNHSLHQAYGFEPVQWTQIASGGTTFSSPTDINGGQYVAVQGPSHSLYFYISSTSGCYFFCGSGTSVYQVGNPGTTYSAPAALMDGNGNVDFAAIGPNGSILAWWQIQGVYYGPVQVAGPGSAFLSPN